MNKEQKWIEDLIGQFTYRRYELKISQNEATCQIESGLRI